MNIGGRIDENGVRTEEKRASEVLPGEKFGKRKGENIIGIFG
jgi:hypothetical protein